MPIQYFFHIFLAIFAPLVKSVRFAVHSRANSKAQGTCYFLVPTDISNVLWGQCYYPFSITFWKAHLEECFLENWDMC